MARWQITLRQSGATPSPAIGTLTLTRWAGDKPQRKRVSHIGIGDRSPANVLTLQGSALISTYSYFWPISCLVTETQKDQFESMLNWQDSLYGSGSDGHILMTEEMEYLAPETTGSHSRTLIGGTTVVTSWSQTKGFGEFKVKLIAGEDYLSHAGFSPALGNAKLLQFIAYELI